MKKNLFTIFVLVLTHFTQMYAQPFATLSSGCNNAVNSIAVNGSGTIYTGGVFTLAGGTSANHVAKWDGATWAGMDNGMSANVRSLLIFNNELYAAGDFINAGAASTVVWMVTKWNGSAWTALNGGIRGVSVYALEAYQNELYAGGFFDTVYNPGKAIVKWNGTAWAALGGIANNGVFGAPGYRVRAIKSFGGNLYVGGTFTTAGGITANNIAMWNGSTWSAIGTGTNGDVNAFGVYNNELYAGGSFTLANGVAVNNIAKISGNTFTALGSGTDGAVNALFEYQNNLFISGSFTTSGGVVTQNISRWDGTSWHDLPGGINGIDGTGYSLATYNGSLYVGGLFAVAGTLVQANSIVKWNSTVGIKVNKADAKNLSVYPNPVKDLLKMTYNTTTNETCSIAICDVEGRTVYASNGNFINGSNEKEISLKGIEPGIYFLKVNTKNNSQAAKIFIE